MNRTSAIISITVNANTARKDIDALAAYADRSFKKRERAENQFIRQRGQLKEAEEARSARKELAQKLKISQQVARFQRNEEAKQRAEVQKTEKARAREILRTARVQEMQAKRNARAEAKESERLAKIRRGQGGTAFTRAGDATGSFIGNLGAGFVGGAVRTLGGVIKTGAEETIGRGASTAINTRQAVKEIIRDSGNFGKIKDTDLESRIYDVSKEQKGFTPEMGASILKTWVAEGADLQSGMDSLEDMAILMQASGTAAEDLGTAMASLKNQIKNEDPKDLFNTTIVSGRKGNLESKAIAQFLPMIVSGMKTGGVEQSSEGYNSALTTLQFIKSYKGTDAETARGYQRFNQRFSLNEKKLKGMGIKNTGRSDETLINVATSKITEDDADTIFGQEVMPYLQPLLKMRDKMKKEGKSKEAIRSAITAEVTAKKVDAKQSFESRKSEARDMQKNASASLENIITSIADAFSKGGFIEKVNELAESLGPLAESAIPMVLAGMELLAEILPIVVEALGWVIKLLGKGDTITKYEDAMQSYKDEREIVKKINESKSVLSEAEKDPSAYPGLDKELVKANIKRMEGERGKIISLREAKNVAYAADKKNAENKTFSQYLGTGMKYLGYATGNLPGAFASNMQEEGYTDGLVGMSNTDRIAGSGSEKDIKAVANKLNDSTSKGERATQVDLTLGNTASETAKKISEQGNAASAAAKANDELASKMLSAAQTISDAMNIVRGSVAGNFPTSSG